MARSSGGDRPVRPVSESAEKRCGCSADHLSRVRDVLSPTESERQIWISVTGGGSGERLPVRVMEVDPHEVAEVCDWYLAEAEAGRILGRSRRPIKASTLAMDKSRIEVHIKPLPGRRLIATLKLGDIEGAQADIAAGKTSKPRAGSRGGATTGGEGVAARTMSTLHAIFEHAVRLGKIDANPARGVRRLAGKARERRLSRSEIARFGRAMRFASEAGEHPTGLAAIRFLLLTGFRRMEGLGVKRLWLDTEEGSVRLPDTKSGAQTPRAPGEHPLVP